MQVELMEYDPAGNRPAFPGNRGFLILAKLRGIRNVTREAFRRIKAFSYEYCKEKYPGSLKVKEIEEGTNGQEEPVEAKEEGTDAGDATATATTDKVENADTWVEKTEIKFGPHEVVYDNCCFILSNLADPSEYAYYAFNKMADNPDWPQPRFPLRVMPVQEICVLTPKAVEAAVRPLLEKTFGGDEPIRFSIIIHGKTSQDSKEMPRQQVEALVRSIIWATNPNCVQCIKYQDYAILLESIDPLLYFGIAKDFNMLGRYNTATIHGGRDMKETMDDSEDEISDNPDLSEADNIKRKLKIKKNKRRLEKLAEEEKNSKQGKFEDEAMNADEASKEDEELGKNGGD